MARRTSARQPGARSGSNSMTAVPRGMELSRMVFTSAVQVKTFVYDAMRKHESGLTRTAPRVATLRTLAAESPANTAGAPKESCLSSNSWSFTGDTLRCRRVVTPGRWRSTLHRSTIVRNSGGCCVPFRDRSDGGGTRQPSAQPPTSLGARPRSSASSSAAGVPATHTTP